MRKAQTEVELLSHDLQKGIKNMMSGRETLEDLDDRAVEMRGIYLPNVGLAKEF